MSPRWTDLWDARLLNIFGNILLKSITCADPRPRGILGESSKASEHQERWFLESVVHLRSRADRLQREERDTKLMILWTLMNGKLCVVGKMTRLETWFPRKVHGQKFQLNNSNEESEKCLKETSRRIKCENVTISNSLPISIYYLCIYFFQEKIYFK